MELEYLHVQVLCAAGILCSKKFRIGGGGGGGFEARQVLDIPPPPPSINPGELLRTSIVLQIYHCDCILQPTAVANRAAGISIGSRYLPWPVAV